MRKEFLEDYEAREIETYDRYKREVLTHALDHDVLSPVLNRFSKINKPLVHCEPSVFATDKEKIWSQVPFAGTLIIPLYNVPEENLLEANGFEFHDIPKLIDLAKEVGRVQFVLATYPKLYQGLDYLEPILTELKPPMSPGFPLEGLVDYKLYDSWAEEFYTLANISYDEDLKQEVLRMGGGKAEFLKLKYDQAVTYADLKLFQMNEIAENVENLIVDDPATAYYILDGMHFMITALMDGLHANRNVSLAKLRYYYPLLRLNPQQVKIPVEIGSYLMKKLTLRPSSYEACITVIDHYKQSDLYRVLESLDEGVRNRATDVVQKNINELDVIMDNIWRDANKMKSYREGILDGISTVIGLVGYFIEGVPGLFAGLGWDVVDRRLQLTDKLGDKVLKWMNRDYLVNIYEFKQKCHIDP